MSFTKPVPNRVRTLYKEIWNSEIVVDHNVTDDTLSELDRRLNEAQTHHESEDNSASLSQSMVQYLYRQNPAS